MLPDIRRALQSLLHEQGGVPREVDIRFEAPTREWVDRLMRPTINLFLFDLQENTDLRQTNFQTTRGDTQAERRLAPRRIDLRYMVSALTTDIDDEDRLLWRTLVTLMKHPQLPPEVLPEELRLLKPPLATRVLQADEGPPLLDIWNALGARPHPALCYMVTAPLDLSVTITEPLVLSRTVRYRRDQPGGLGMARDREIVTDIRGIVRGKEREPLTSVTVTVEGSAGDGSVTNETGRFTLRGVPSGSVPLLITRADGSHKRVVIKVPAEPVDVPAESYDIFYEIIMD